MKVLQQEKESELIEVSIKDLKRGQNLNLTTIFHESESKRLKVKNTSPENEDFTITVNTPIDELSHFSEKELLADELVNYKAIPFCEADLSVFHNDSYIDLALQRGETKITIRRFKTSLTEQEKFAIQLRYGFREGQIDNMNRMEAIRYAVDTFKWSPKFLTQLMIKADGKNWPDVEREYYVGKIYEEFTDYEVGFTKERLTPRSFSSLKAILRKKEIKQLITTSRDMRERVVNISINKALNPGVGRIEDHMTNIFKHEETKKAFFEQGFAPAIDILKAKYPDSDKGTYPEKDILAAQKKLENSTVRSFIQGQLKRNPTSNKLFNSLMEIVYLISEESLTAQRQIAELMTELNPSLVATVLKDKGYQDISSIGKQA